jgi:hypothetical protein
MKHPLKNRWAETESAQPALEVLSTIASPDTHQEAATPKKCNVGKV